MAANQALVDALVRSGIFTVGATDIAAAIVTQAGGTLVGPAIAGLAPPSGGGTSAFLRADTTFAVPANFTPGAPGFAPASGGGTGSYLRADATWGVPTGTIYSVFTSVASGLAPASGGGTVAYLRADGSWQVPAGTGDMALAAAQNITGAKSFNDATLILKGLTSGTLTLTAPAVAGAINWTFPIGSDQVTGIAATQTLTNKTLTQPNISAILNGASLLSLPTTPDVLIGRATTDTLNNKLLASSCTAATQTPGDNSTKLATTAYADTKATAGVFTSVAAGQVPASGGGTTSFLRADGNFATPSALTDVATVIAATIVVPLDREGQGRYMPAQLLTAASALTVGAGPIENGNCVFCLVGDGNPAHVPDLSAFKNINGYAYNYVLNAANVYSSVYLYGTAGLYGEQRNDIDLSPPTLLSAVVPNASSLTMVLTWSKPMNTTVSAFSAFAISAGHTLTAHTYTTATTTTLTFATAYVAGDAATTLAYTQPGTNPMKDTAATPNLAVSFSGFAITNNVIPVAPTITLGTPTSTTQPMTLTAPAGATSRTVQVRTTTGPGAWGNAAGSFVGNVFTATGLTASTSFDYQASSTGTAGTSAYGASVTGSTASGASARSDNFTRATSATTMNPPSDGLANYQIDGTGSPAFGIAANAGYIASNGSGAANCYATWDRGATSYTHTVTFKPDNADYVLSVFRYTDANNHWRIQTQGNDFSLIKRVAGADTNVVSTSGGAGSPFTFNGATSHTAVVAVTPSGFTVTIDSINTALTQASETTNASATRAGFGGYTSGGAGGSRVTAMSTS